jgi:tRNA-modifying protein YgfZ
MEENSLTMQAALLPDRGVVKVIGDDARRFLHGLLSGDILALTPELARYSALLTPQGKIVADVIVSEAPAADGGGFFLDVARVRAKPLVDKLNLYKLRSRVVVEDLSDSLGILAVWNGRGSHAFGLAYADPRLPSLGLRIMIPPHRAADAAAKIGARLVAAAEYEAHRIALGIPSGGVDFTYGDAFPHEADMDQLGGVDFAKGCYVGQEVVSRMEHRGIARTRAVPVDYDGAAPPPGAAIMAGERQLGTMGSAAAGRGIALLRLDRLAEALARGETVLAAGVAIRPAKPDWAHFDFPGAPKAAAE